MPEAQDIQVLIAGAGLGGLALAQSLRRAGIVVRVFERDSSPWDRPQGYRLHLDADAIGAIYEVLPPSLHAVFEATAQRTEPYTTILDTDLSVIKRLPTHDDVGDVWPARLGAAEHCNVDRATLRQILLAGLDDAVEYDRKLVAYESRMDGVVAYFEDGGTAEGSVLVGADGIHSIVRAQRAPNCETADAGILAIYGRIPIDQAETLAPPEALGDIFTIASDNRKVFLGLGSVRFPTPPDRPGEQFAATTIKPQDDYLVCIVGGRGEFLPRDHQTMKAATPADLQAVAAEMLAAWPAKASELVLRGDPASFFMVDMYTSVPCSLDAPTNVTLLGDAIHAMTPTLGRGANLAMRDGALLARALKAVAAGEMKLAAALTDYERDLVKYGFDVVREAARIGEQRMAQNPLPR